MNYIDFHSSEMFVSVYQCTQCCISEDWSLDLAVTYFRTSVTISLSKTVDSSKIECSIPYFTH